MTSNPTTDTQSGTSVRPGNENGRATAAYTTLAIASVAPSLRT